MNICHFKYCANCCLLIILGIFTSPLYSENHPRKSTGTFSRIKTAFTTFSTCAKNGLTCMVNTKNRIHNTLGRISPDPRTKNIIKKFIIPSLAVIGSCIGGYKLLNILFDGFPPFVREPQPIIPQQHANNPVHQVQPIQDANHCHICSFPINNNRIGLLPCRHKDFCQHCIEARSWAEKKTCPTCNQRIEQIYVYSLGKISNY